MTDQRDPIQDIQSRLRKYPHVHFEATARSVTVFPLDATGFTVRFDQSAPWRSAAPYSVSCEGWHEQFDDVEEALNCFAFALSRACRLEVWKRGGTPYKWILQNQGPSGWVNDSAVGLWFFKFWRRPEIVHLQNRLLEAA